VLCASGADCVQERHKNFILVRAECPYDQLGDLRYPTLCNRGLQTGREGRIPKYLVNG
jgi:hypothetical protein